MEKKLPSVFSNPINKEIKNNEEFYYGNLNEKELKSPKEINKQINQIFNSKDFVYKKKVKIKTFDDEQIITLVGKNQNSLLTLDNKAIPIINITQIEEIK